MKYFLFIAIWLLAVLPVLEAQQVVTGRITDAMDGKPISGVEIYIANTTIGTTSEEYGNYTLTIQGEGSFEIVVSHVGYRPAFVKINTPKPLHQVDVVLDINELSEVVIKASVHYRQQDVDLFWRRILGVKPSKSGLEVLNPEKLFFYLNHDDILKVSCREPIEIINHEMGYHIRYVLENFQHDYWTNQTTFYGQPIFKELTPQNSRQKNRWEKKRQKVYAVSFTHFIRALYREHIHEEGFFLTKKDSLAVFPLKDILQAKQERVQVNIGSPLYLACISKPVTAQMIQNGHETVMLNAPTVPVMILLPQQFIIYPDGPYSGLLKIQEYRNSISGLSTTLPVEYENRVLSAATPGQNGIPDILPLMFHNQLAYFPQEKIYLHTDKPWYISGEQIWFRAHVAGAASHVPVHASQYVYVELINPFDTIVTRVKIRQKAGAYHGYLLIPEDVPEGDYTLRAYTTFMRSQDEHYFCTKTVRIGDPQARAIHVETQFVFDPNNRTTATFRFLHVSSSAPLVPQSVKLSINGGKPMNIDVDDGGRAGVHFNLPATSRKRMILLETTAFNYPYRQFIRIPMSDDDFDVTFYPEGGSLMQGAFCRMAFKAMRSDGQPAQMSGIIYDQDMTEISNLESDHLGMGGCSMLAEKGKTYYALCWNEKGQTKRFDLPAAVDHGYPLSVNPVRDKVYVSILQPAGTAQKDTLYLLAHTRDVAYYSAPWDHETEAFALRSDMFPSGVLHLILFDAGLKPASERLVFINRQDQAEVSCRPEQETYAARSLVKTSVTVVDSDGEPLEGRFSVAVTSDREVTPDSTSNILTHLLLTSDLRGYIENPAYYFQNTNASAYALDLLMLTQGWRRYDVAKLAHGRYLQPARPIETGAEISGTVKSLLLGKPAEGMDVTAMSIGGNYSDKTKTDKDGRFSLVGGELPDNTKFIVSSVPKNRNTRMDLVIDTETFPERTLPVVPSVGIDRFQFAQYANITEQKYTLENGERVVHLSEVTITAQRKQPKKLSFYTVESRNSITEEELERQPAGDIRDILRRIPRVSVTRVYNELEEREMDVIGIRGMSGGPALILLDNFSIEAEDVAMISPYDIAQVDVLTDPSNLALFGMRGAGGVIAIHTKDPSTKKSAPPFHIKTIMPLGYQSPVEFYAPKYDTPAKQRVQIPDLRTTIHWQPVVQTDSLGVASFEFHTADEPASYTVIIEGLAGNGKIIRQEGKVLRKK